MPIAQKYSNTPAGRCIAKAERELGRLTDGQKVDLLLDNFPEIANSQEARDILKTVTCEEVTDAQR